MFSVCHGPAVFQNLIDPVTGEPLIKGKTITGFTTETETVMYLEKELKGCDTPLVEETAAAMGATCKCGELPTPVHEKDPQHSSP